MQMNNLKKALKGNKDLMWGINKNGEEFIFSNFWFLKCRGGRFPNSIVLTLLPYFTSRPAKLRECVESFEGIDEDERVRDLTQIEKTIETFVKEKQVPAKRTHLSEGNFELIYSGKLGYRHYNKDITSLIPHENYSMSIIDSETAPMLIVDFIDTVNYKEFNFTLGILPVRNINKNQYLKEEF